MDRFRAALLVVSFALGVATIYEIVDGRDVAEIVMTAIPAAICAGCWRLWGWLQDRQ